MEYFSYTPYSGFETQHTDEDAQIKVRGDLEYAREQIVKSGPDMVELSEFCCGKITHMAKEAFRDEKNIESLFDLAADFELQEVDSDEQ